jgi:hypothetical protein
MIESFNFGTIVIDGEEISHDIIIYPDRIDASWWRMKAHSLEKEDLTNVIEFEPEVLIVGTGANGRMRFPEETQDYIKSKGIELIISDTSRACEDYNKLKDKKKTVAVLHLTC